MSHEYDEYLINHRHGVKLAYLWLREFVPGIVPTSPYDLAQSIESQITTYHDGSKECAEEYDAYDKYFYGKNKSYSVVQNFNKAWLHHIHANPHHWQHWILINDDPEKGEIILEMPYEYVIEMICDWWSFGWIQEKLQELFKWYDEHKDYIKLHPKTRKTVEDILGKIKEKLEELS